MSYRISFYRTLAVLILGLTATLSSLPVAAEQARPIIVIHTFDVHANATGFLDIIDRAIKLSKKVHPGGGGKIEVIAGHVEGEAASLITVATTYPDMDTYGKNLDVMENNPELLAIYKEMQDADFKIVHRSINTLVAEY